MLKTRISIDSSIKANIPIDYDGVDDGDGCSGNFDVTFQVTRWRSGQSSSASMVAFDCVSEAYYEKPIPVALD